MVPSHHARKNIRQLNSGCPSLSMQANLSLSLSLFRDRSSNVPLAQNQFFVGRLLPPFAAARCPSSTAPHGCISPETRKKNRFEYILVDEGLGLYRAVKEFENSRETWWLWQEEGTRKWYAGIGREEALTPEDWSADEVDIAWSCKGGCNRTGEHSWTMWHAKSGTWGEPTNVPTEVAEFETIEREQRPHCCGWYNPERDDDPSDSDGPGYPSGDRDSSDDESPGVGAGATPVAGGVWGPPPPGPPPGQPPPDVLRPPRPSKAASQPRPPSVPADPEELPESWGSWADAKTAWWSSSWTDADWGRRSWVDRGKDDDTGNDQDRWKSWRSSDGQPYWTTSEGKGDSTASGSGGPAAATPAAASPAARPAAAMRSSATKPTAAKPAAKPAATPAAKPASAGPPTATAARAAASRAVGSGGSASKATAAHGAAAKHAALRPLVPVPAKPARAAPADPAASAAAVGPADADGPAAGRVPAARWARAKPPAAEERHIQPPRPDVPRTVGLGTSSSSNAAAAAATEPAPDVGATEPARDGAAAPARDGAASPARDGAADRAAAAAEPAAEGSGGCVQPDTPPEAFAAAGRSATSFYPASGQ